MDSPRDDERIWTSLRERSLRPGGFGEDRARIWPALLGAQPLSDPPPYSEVDSTNEHGNPVEESPETECPHADERQIKLDTDRSFVLYPGESGTAPARDALQSDLHGLLVSLFRKRRSLHYFQGFHDIMTVLFLTLPRPLHLACAEKMALHRVRDAMGVGLEPVLGLLRVLRNLLRLADPVYANLLESVSPLPYHALSHLLTLFSHDVPTLPLIQHVWDFLLSREPIAVVWLTAALVLHRRPSIYMLAEQDEEGMIHSVLGGIPELVDAESEFQAVGEMDLARGTTGIDFVADNGIASGPHPRPCLNDGCTKVQSRSGAVDRALVVQATDVQTRLSHDGDEPGQVTVPSHVIPGDMITENNPDPHARSVSCAELLTCDPVHATRGPTLELAASIPLPDSRTGSPDPSSPRQSVKSLPLEERPSDVSLSTSDSLPSTRPSTPLRSPFVPREPASDIGKATPNKARSKPPPLSLTHLLRQADDLLNMYPPSHPSLHVTEIMGTDSVMRTWRPLSIVAKDRDAVPEKLAYNESDDYLETLVNSPHIVVPSPPPSPPLSPRGSVKKARVSPRGLSKAILDPRRLGFRLGALTPAERRVLLMGALLVVGAAVALKSSKIVCMDGIVKGDSVKRLWNGKWSFFSSVVAAWGRGLP